MTSTKTSKTTKSANDDNAMLAEGTVRKDTLNWRVNTPAFLQEICNNNDSMAVMRKPLMIFSAILGEVATRASELNDDKLNALMCRLALYEISDPYSKDYDALKVRELIRKGQ